MLSTTAIIAANRFGLGARPEERAALARDPRAWLKAQYLAPPAIPAAYAGFPPAAERNRQFIEARAAQGDGGAAEVVRKLLRERFADEAGARLEAAVVSDTPAVERLVDFWFNHFTVSVQRPAIGPMCSGFEREAIRPHVLGRFADLLVAVVRHPAMLGYLDNVLSIGPDSIAGRRLGRRAGLNENLARELLELHTVGVDAGYTQADVRELAKLLTGWSVGRAGGPLAGGRAGVMPAAVGAFHFYPELHQPGPKTLLGQHFHDEDDEREGLAALRFLANHPATAEHIARKLVRHFVADDPPPAAVARIARVFAGTAGDLRAVMLALVDLPDVWAAPLPKVRNPQNFLVAALRAGGQKPPPRQRLFFMARELGQPVYGALSPAGWPDVAKEWVAPDAMLRRIDLARTFGQALAPYADPRDLAALALGQAADAQIHRAIAGAPSRAEGLALVFAAAEFQRR
jgi:uncharacterized protein (DUF1800 family)